MLTTEELDWLRKTLEVKDKPLEVSESYKYRISIIKEREANKEEVRKRLDHLRGEFNLYTPKELIVLKNNRKPSGDVSFIEGVYIIHNITLNVYYVGKSETLKRRAAMHFLPNEGNEEIYNDFEFGDCFLVSLIPLKETPFRTLNEFEDNAIRAYDSFRQGYNKNPGNVLDKTIFSSDLYEEAAYLLLSKIKNTEEFLHLTNLKNRRLYIIQMFDEFDLPFNKLFIKQLTRLIKDYHKANKEKIKELKKQGMEKQ